MDYNQFKSLEDIKKYIDEYTTFPTMIVNDELHILINNRDFESFKENLGDNILIKIRNFKTGEYHFKLNVIAEKDGVELINIEKIFDTEFERNVGEAIWNHIISKLIENDIIHPNELKLGGSLILSMHDTHLWDCDRVAMKILKDVFDDFEVDELENIRNDIVNESPGFWIDVTFIGINNNTIASIMVLANNHKYCETYECSVFELKEKLIEIRKELENLGFCKKKEN